MEVIPPGPGGARAAVAASEVGDGLAGAVAGALTGEHRAADSPSLRVRGGIGGLAVELDALGEAAEALRRCAGALAGVPGELAPWRAAPALAAVAALDPRGAVDVEVALARALGPTGAPALAVRVEALGAHLAAVVMAYRGVDAASAAVWRSLRAAASGGPAGDLVRSAVLPWHAAVRAGIPAPRAGDPPLPAGAGDVVTGTLAAVLGGGGATPADVAAALAAGATTLGVLGGTAAVVTAAPPVPGPPPPPGRPASGVGELLQRVDALYPAASGPPGALPGTPSAPRPGQVRVERINRPGRPPAAVVYVPGTETWALDGPVPMDGGTDLRALAGRRTAATEAVTGALELAGVGPDDPLLLVGHSQGGMTAAQLAGDPAFRARFDPRAVVTAGSPVALAAVPDDVVVLSLQHDGDWVPGLDGADAPDTATRTTVTAPVPPGAAPHDASGYAVTGALVDASDDPSLVAVREALAPFLDAQDATSTSTEWVARRAG